MNERVECDPPAAGGGEPTCGHADMQGFDVLLECVRPPHGDDLHRTVIGQRWHCAEMVTPPGSDTSC